MMQVQEQHEYRAAQDSYRMHLLTANRLEAEAWAAYNSAFHTPESEDYRRTGRELYHRVLEEKIQALYLRGDEQNSIIEANLKH
jgi:hypothetical protein